MSQKKFNELIQRTGDKFENLVDRFTSGKISLEEFETSFVYELGYAHVHSAKLGRLINGAGDDVVTSADILIATPNVDMQLEYLRRFLDEMEEMEDSKILTRALYYLPQIRLSSIDSWLESLDGATEIDWITTAFESCTNCPWLEANGPWVKANLITRPGSTVLECGRNCKCYLRERKNGSETFRPAV